MNDSKQSYLQRLIEYDLFTEPLQRQIVDWLEIQSSDHILDAGCGAGGFTQHLSEIGCRVTAIDASVEAVRYVSSLFENFRDNSRIEVSEQDILDLPYNDASFDLVWCSRVIHHLSDQLAGLKALAGVTDRGGRLAIREGGVPLRVLPYELEIGPPAFNLASMSPMTPGLPT